MVVARVVIASGIQGALLIEGNTSGDIDFKKHRITNREDANELSVATKAKAAINPEMPALYSFNTSTMLSLGEPARRSSRTFLIARKTPAKTPKAAADFSVAELRVDLFNNTNGAA